MVVTVVTVVVVVVVGVVVVVAEDEERKKEEVERKYDSASIRQHIINDKRKAVKHSPFPQFLSIASTQLIAEG